VSKHLDYETSTSYKIDIRARDKGSLAMEGHCTIQVTVLDVNDNAPEIIITSSPKPVREDAPAGTMVALINVKDLDSGVNGNVTLSMSPGTPFKLKPTFSNHYALVTDSQLDREEFPRYDIELKASDSGSPPLISSKLITVNILDVNDNPPVFSERVYSVYIKENSAPGSVLASVTASDLDTGENAKIVYSVLDTNTQGVPVSSYVYINSENGSIFSMHSFDYEKMKVFHIIVLAKDHGSPSLSSNTTIHVFISDQNDNAPAVIYPSTSMGSVTHQRMPRSAKAGHLVTKVTAVDADSGHNAWLFYRLAEATDASLFSVNLHTGEVRTKRAVSEHDDSSQRLLIEIKDNGEPIQSTTVTVDILIEEGVHEPVSDYSMKTTENNKKNGKITLYLIISLGTVRTDSEYKNPNRNLQIQLNTDGPIKYVEVLGGDMMSQSQSFGSYLSPMSEFSDLTLIKPSSTTNFTDTLNVLDA
ncbi:hypothetical protein M9458_021791, partial [Cirrhinus mrigala]